MSADNLSNAPSGRAPTSIDVARKAGVSQASVSRYLNGKPINPDMIEPIRAAIAELGYRPNLSARSLVTAKSNLIAVVLGDMLNGYYSELFSTLNQELGRNGLRSIIVEGRVGINNNPGQILSEVDVDGVIVATSLMLAPQEELILESGLPTVFFNRTNFAKSDTVHAENLLGGQLAAEHLLGLGHRKIAVISGPDGADAVVARHRGFTSTLERAGVVIPPDEIEVPGFNYDTAYAAATKLLQRDGRPTALFCHNDQTAFAALNAARALSIKVPDQLSIIGFDDVSMSSWESVSLTTVRQPIREMAKVAVHLMVKRLREPDRAIQAMTLPCTLIERSSTGPAPSSS